MPKLLTEKPIDFTSNLEVSTVFMEFKGKLLLLFRPSNKCFPSTWGIPGGKLEKGETPLDGLVREIQEELGLRPDPSECSHFHSLYVRHPQMDYKLHLFQWKLDSLPLIVLNPEEHLDCRWQPISEFSTLPLLAGQLEAFHFVYGKNF